MSYYTIFMSIMLVVAIFFNKNIATTKRRRYLWYSLMVLGGSIVELIVGTENCYFTIIELGTGLLFLVFVLKMIVKTKKVYQKNLTEWVLISIFIILSYFLKKNIYDIAKIGWMTISIASIFIYLNMCAIEQSIDGLTKLLNQNNFKNYIPRKKCIVIVFDVNDFKYINDTYGHDFGDVILQNVAEILKETYKKYGKCYRIGGDEFAVILENRLSELENLNAKFIDNIVRKRDDIPAIPNVSYGCSMYIPGVFTFSENIKYADAEMYEHKKAEKAKKEK